MYALSIMGLKYISIHTTRKVVTVAVSIKVALQFNFNPHHPQGGDNQALLVYLFQKYFNPHHPQGGDADKFAVCFLTYISIHTTRKVVTVYHLVWDFQ